MSEQLTIPPLLTAQEEGVHEEWHDKVWSHSQPDSVEEPLDGEALARVPCRGEREGWCE